MAVQRLPVLTDGEELVEIRRQIDALEYRFAKVLARFEKSREWAGDGAASATAWLRWKCRLPANAATQRVGLARTLEALPEVDQVFAEGEIGFSHASSISALTEVVGADAVRPGVETVVDVATRLSADRFRFAMRHLRHLLDSEGASEDARREHDRRWLALSETLDGVYILDGRLDPEGGAAVKAALDRLMKPCGRDDVRTARQRRADALVELASGGQPAHLTISTSGAELGREPVLPFEALRRLACDSVVTEVDPEKGTIGSRHSIPPSLRRALELRDGGCTAPGCERPVEWCEAHHIEHWVDGGPTSLDNLRLYCRYHHRLDHERESRRPVTRPP